MPAGTRVCRTVRWVPERRRSAPPCDVSSYRSPYELGLAPYVPPPAPTPEPDEDGGDGNGNDRGHGNGGGHGNGNGNGNGNGRG